MFIVFIASLEKTIRRFIIKIEKRTRFAIGSVLLTCLMLFSTFFFFDKALIFALLFFAASYVVVYFCITEEIEKIEWLMLFLVPVLFTVSFYFFFFLFPVRWITRIPFMIFYLISIYAVLLASNIFNVGVGKNLQLYRAAFSVNYLYQTIIMFFILNVLFSLQFNFLLRTVIVFFFAFVLSVHLFWSIRLKLVLEKESVIFGLFVAFVLSEIAVITAFVPSKPSIGALFLTAFYYCLAGITYLYLDRRLFKENLREYVAVLVIVTLVMILSLGW